MKRYRKSRRKQPANAKARTCIGGAQVEARGQPAYNRTSMFVQHRGEGRQAKVRCRSVCIDDSSYSKRVQQAGAVTRQAGTWQCPNR